MSATHDMALDALIARMDARDAARDEWIASLVGDPAVELPSRCDPTRTLLVSRDPSKPAGWRVTWFDDGEATGHTERATWRDAALAAVDDYSGDFRAAVVHVLAADVRKMAGQ